MSSWSIIHRVRYPPFDDKRLNANSAPIFEDEIASNLSDDEVVKVLPPYIIQSSEGWLIERSIVDNNGKTKIANWKKVEINTFSISDFFLQTISISKRIKLK